MRLFTLTLLLLFSLPAFAASRAVLIGGSGEAEEENFLVLDLRILRTHLQERGWDVSAAVGARSGLLGDSHPALGKNIDKALQRAASQSLKGDQLLIVIHSHGREREGSLGQKTHSIVAEDPGVESTDLGYDLDRLAPHLEKAHAQGAITAVIDLSCYSGTIHALTMADCTASLAAPDYVSSCSGRPEERLFTSFFFTLPEGPISLEAQFLQARAKDRTSVNLPQISSRLTPAASAWFQLLTEVDPLDVYSELDEYRIGAPPYPASVLQKAMPKKEWLEVEPKVNSLLSTRLLIENKMNDLRKYHEGPIQLLTLVSRQVPVTPGRLGDWLEQLEDPQPASDVEGSILSALKEQKSRLEPDWAPFVNPYLAEKKIFSELRNTLAQQAGELFAWERDFYPDSPKPAEKARDARNFFSFPAVAEKVESQ